jgi:hypothetical protein
LLESAYRQALQTRDLVGDSRGLIAWNQRGNVVVADWDFRGDIHAQHTVLCQPGGWARDRLCRECERRSDQRGGREGSGNHRIAGSIGAI